MTFAFVGGLSISMGEPPSRPHYPLSCFLTTTTTALLISPLATVCIGKFGTRSTLRIGVVLQT